VIFITIYSFSSVHERNILNKSYYCISRITHYKKNFTPTVVQAQGHGYTAKKLASIEY